VTQGGHWRPAAWHSRSTALLSLAAPPPPPPPHTRPSPPPARQQGGPGGPAHREQGGGAGVRGRGARWRCACPQGKPPGAPFSEHHSTAAPAAAAASSDASSDRGRLHSGRPCAHTGAHRRSAPHSPPHTRRWARCSTRPRPKRPPTSTTSSGALSARPAVAARCWAPGPARCAALRRVQALPDGGLAGWLPRRGRNAPTRALPCPALPCPAPPQRAGAAAAQGGGAAAAGGRHRAGEPGRAAGAQEEQLLLSRGGGGGRGPGVCVCGVAGLRAGVLLELQRRLGVELGCAAGCWLLAAAGAAWLGA
jgi:hypothetical protein